LTQVHFGSILRPSAGSSLEVPRAPRSRQGHAAQGEGAALHHRPPARRVYRNVPLVLRCGTVGR